MEIYQTNEGKKKKLGQWVDQLKNDIVDSRAYQMLKKYLQFVGPGFIVSVAYMDPGNYSTDVSAGAEFQYKLLTTVLMACIVAVILQSFCVKLGSVTGKNLAENCREHFPRWLNWGLYIISEIMIIATDLAELIGAAIALNMLFNLPILAGVFIASADVLIVLIFWQGRKMRYARFFELLVAGFVFAVVVCFIIELAKLKNVDIGVLFKGYVPSGTAFSSSGLYASIGIIGATVMPHSLFLGSELVMPRLIDYDINAGNYTPPDESNDCQDYAPTVDAIRYTQSYAITEVCIALLTIALFVNSSILIVAGATLYNMPNSASANLFSMYDLLKIQIGKAAAIIFALSLLSSGLSAGIVATMAGQIVSEGFLNWRIKPWARRLVTRAISIIPAAIVAGCVGKKGLNSMLNASQVVLSLILPFVVGPLVYFTSNPRIMTVKVISLPTSNDNTVNNKLSSVEITTSTASQAHDVSTAEQNSIKEPSNTELQLPAPSRIAAQAESQEIIKMHNNLFITVVLFIIWLVLTGLNVYLVVDFAMGDS